MINSTLTGDASNAMGNTNAIVRPSLSLETTYMLERPSRGVTTGAPMRHGRSGETHKEERRRSPTKNSTDAGKLKRALELVREIDTDDLEDYTLAVNSLGAMFCEMWSGASGLSPQHRQILAATENAVRCLIEGDQFSEDKREALRIGILDLTSPRLTREHVESVNSRLMDAGFSPAAFLTGVADCD